MAIIKTLYERANEHAPEPIGDDPERASQAMLEMLKSLEGDSVDVLRRAGMRLTLGAMAPWNDTVADLRYYSSSIRPHHRLVTMYNILLDEPGVGSRHAECHIFSALYPQHQFSFLEDMTGVHQYVKNGFEMAAQIWLLGRIAGI